MLVEDMNGAFVEPLVTSARGGPGGGGAQLTATGRDVLLLYHEILDRTRAASADQIASLEAKLVVKSACDIPTEK